MKPLPPYGVCVFQLGKIKQNYIIITTKWYKIVSYIQTAKLSTYSTTDADVLCCVYTLERLNIAMKQKKTLIDILDVMFVAFNLIKN